MLKIKNLPFSNPNKKATVVSEATAQQITMDPTSAENPPEQAKKERKKRVSKKLNQLIALNCSTSSIQGVNSIGHTPYLLNECKELKSNKIAMIIESQKLANQAIAAAAALAKTPPAPPVVIETPHMPSIEETPLIELATEECTIETSIVNSLYDDDNNEASPKHVAHNDSHTDTIMYCDEAKCGGVETTTRLG